MNFNEIENYDECVYCGRELPCNELNETTGGGGMCDDCMAEGNE